MVDPDLQGGTEVFRMTLKKSGYVLEKNNSSNKCVSKIEFCLCNRWEMPS